MIRSRKIPGRSLGWSAAEVATKPYASFWTPSMAPLGPEARAALAQGPVAEDLLPPAPEAAAIFFSGAGPIENGFALPDDGSLRVACRTDMPGVTPEMIDWWFGWHSDSPERYKLWHPRAHVHAEWRTAPTPGSTGRARYVGATSLVDEFIGSDFIRGAISFVPPSEFQLEDPALQSGAMTAICARTAPVGLPVTAGALIHQVRRTERGSEMRSRFWLGGGNMTGLGPLGALAAPIARRALRATEADGRALFVHCAEEMAHLAAFLPALHAQCKDRP